MSNYGNYLGHPEVLRPEMTQEELNLLMNTVKGAESIYEFGCGGSTTVFCQMAIPNVYSVDSSLEWLVKVQKSATAIGSPTTLILNYVDINANDKDFGMPKDDSKKFNWYSYPTTFNNVSKTPDVVFVDGRFRVACALESWSNMSEYSKLIVHDYTKRPEYHIIEKYFTKEESAHTLCVFAKRNDVDTDELHKDIEIYKEITK